MTQPKPPSVEALKERFREAIRGLVESAPVSVASAAVRPVAGGPLEPVLTLGFTGEALSPSNRDAPGVELPPLVVGEAAVQWCEANHKELVLDVRPEHVRSEFYRPFARHGLRSVIVLPVFRDDALIGTLAVGSIEREAWTKRHLRLLEIMAAMLAPDFPKPAPAGEQPASAGARLGAAPSEEAERPGGRAAPTLQAADAHVEADALGRVREWDAVAERLFGIPRDEAVGRGLAVFYRASRGRLLGARLADELTARGRFLGRALGWDAEGMPLLCEVELSSFRTPTGARGLRGRFRRLETDALVSHEEIRFDVATRYDFTKPVTRERNSKL